jgi:hypothetical protein
LFPQVFASSAEAIKNREASTMIRFQMSKASLCMVCSPLFFFLASCGSSENSIKGFAFGGSSLNDGTDDRIDETRTISDAAPSEARTSAELEKEAADYERRNLAEAQAKNPGAKIVNYGVDGNVQRIRLATTISPEQVLAPNSSPEPIDIRTPTPFVPFAPSEVSFILKDNCVSCHESYRKKEDVCASKAKILSELNQKTMPKWIGLKFSSTSEYSVLKNWIEASDCQ